MGAWSGEGMEFCPEVAVLMSAGQLASQPETSCEKQTDIWKTAVEEILNGLEYDSSVNQRKLWDYRVHAIMFSCTLKSLLRKHSQSEDTDWGCLTHILTILPPFPEEVYFELVKVFHWRRHFLECLLFLNEDMCLEFLEEALSFCCHGNTVDSHDNCELLLAMVEVYLVWRLDPRTDSTRDKASSRKVSGVYMFMGNVPSVPPEPDNATLSERHALFLQNFLFYTKKLICLDTFLNTLGTMKSVCQSRALDLMCAIIALGGTFLPADQKQLMLISQKWAKVFVRKNSFGEQADEKSSSRSYHDLLAKLKSGNFQTLDSAYQILSSFQNETYLSQSREFLSLTPSSYFPTNQWRVLLEEVLGYSQWVNALSKVVGFWEGSDSSEFDVTLVTVDIHLPSLFVLVGELLKSGDNSTVKNVRDFDSNSQNTMSPDTLVASEDLHQIHLETPRPFAMGSKRRNLSLRGNVFGQLQILLQPVIEESQIFMNKLTDMKLRKETENFSGLPLQEILTRIKDKSLGWESCLDVLLEKDDVLLTSIESVLNILEDNLTILSSEARVVNLFKLVQRLERKTTTPQEVVRQLWRVLLAACSSLPILLQDHLLSLWYRDGYTLTSESDEHFRGSLTTVFNRLVDGSHSEVVDVLCLACQNPEATLHKAVKVAVRNKHQPKVIVKILQGFPSVCQCKSQEDSGNSLLCRAVSKFLATNSLSLPEEENLVEFLTLAVQSFENSSVPKVSFTESPVLDAEEFLLLVVVPYLNRENMIAQNQPITAKLALKMFNCLGQQKCCESISQQFVILLCLCEMLQECERFWDRECRKDYMKQEIITALGFLPLDDPFTAKDPALVWFRGHLSDFSVPVVLRLRTVLGMDEDQCLKVLATQLWVGEQIEHTVAESKADNQYRSAFEFSALDDACLQFSLHAISQIEGRFTFEWDEIVLSLAQVLPDLLHSEWLQVMTVCEHLLTSNRLILLAHAPTYITFSPCVNLTGIKVQLGVAQLLVDVCMVWNQSESLTEPAWVFVAQGLATVIRDICLVDLKLEDSFNSRTCLLAQIFCQLCHMMSILPLQACDHVYLVMLQTLNIYKGVKTESKSASLPGEWRTYFRMCQSFEGTMTDVLKHYVREEMTEKSNLERQMKEIFEIKL